MLAGHVWKTEDKKSEESAGLARVEEGLRGEGRVLVGHVKKKEEKRK